MLTDVVISHAGKQHSYQVARALASLGRLQTFYTSSYIGSAFLQNLIQKSGNTYWSRRFLPGLSGPKIVSNWHFEFREQLYARLFGRSGRVNRAVYERDRNFDAWLAPKFAKLNAEVFWGFQGSCCESLASARRAGMVPVVELATAHYPASVALLQEEKALHPEWAESIVYADFPPWYLDRLVQEPLRADFAVGASQFTLQTLRDAGIPEHKLVLLPLGFDAAGIPYDENHFRPYRNRPLRLVYAGRISQMKGIKYLLEAVKRFVGGQIELHLHGFVQGAEKAFRSYKKHYNHHEHVSQPELFARYREYDALVLPSIYEGFGLVILEAMAAGLPVITTEHTIGPEIITEGENGYIVPIRDVEALQTAIGRLLVKSDDELMAMRRSARAAAMDYTWDRYRDRLQVVLKRICDV